MVFYLALSRKEEDDMIQNPIDVNSVNASNAKDPYKKTDMFYIIKNNDVTPENEILDSITKTYIENRSITPENHPTHAVMERELLTLTHYEYALFNSQFGQDEKSKRYRCKNHLTAGQIVDMMFATHHIIRISMTGSLNDTNFDVLAIYIDKGQDEGIYRYEPDNDSIKRQITKFNYSISASDKKTVLDRLEEEAPRRVLTIDQDLIPVANGVFNFATKELLPFSPDYTFMAKSDVAYNPSATNVVIHNDTDGTDWDYDSWMNELSDDPEIVLFLWQILAAIVRPFVHWNKAIFLTSEKGCNGKGTLLSFARSLTKGSVSLQISDFSSRFGCEKLIGKNAILCDELDVGDYYERCANFKAVCTNDVVSVDRKGLPVIDYKFEGITVMCCNSRFRTKDRTNSLARRLCFVEMGRSFEDCERKYIKEDYLKRDSVKEYVMYRILHMNFYEFDIPQACKDALEEFKEYNDPVKRFTDEILPKLVWDFVPFSFLHDLYVSWTRRTNPSGRPMEREAFINDLLIHLEKNPDWYCKDKKCFHRPGKKMDTPEYLIKEYDLKEWYNNVYCGGDLAKLCTPNTLKTTYRGIHRVGHVADIDPTDETEDVSTEKGA